MPARALTRPGSLATTSGVFTRHDVALQTRAKPIARSDQRITSQIAGSIGKETVLSGRFDGAIAEEGAAAIGICRHGTSTQSVAEPCAVTEHFRSVVPEHAVEVLCLIATVRAPFCLADLVRQLGWSKSRASYWLDQFSSRRGALVRSGPETRARYSWRVL